jgi:hypothetical protein
MIDVVVLLSCLLGFLWLEIWIFRDVEDEKLKHSNAQTPRMLSATNWISTRRLKNQLQ